MRPRSQDAVSGADGSCGDSYLCTGSTVYDGLSGHGVAHGTAAFTGCTSLRTEPVRSHRAVCARPDRPAVMCR
ncbi:hypothetical protein [Streptomyces spinosirectus]